MIMIYAVFYYEMTGGRTLVMTAGFYTNFTDAHNILKKIIPNYKNHINDTVINNRYCGWINQFDFGVMNEDINGFSGPSHSVNIDLYLQYYENSMAIVVTDKMDSEMEVDIGSLKI